MVIRNGEVVDGSGRDRYHADIGISGGRITEIGRIARGGARAELDAEGQVVTPGFIDGHTHMDAQLFWDPLGTCSCWHGVTTVVMGNCGFTLAPAPIEQRSYVLRNLERSEDIPAEVMAAGIPDWGWTTFREYLDVLDGLPKGINYLSQIGHSALRTYAMGERAFTEAAGEDDLRAMESELADALAAGATGLTTSRSPNHLTPDGKPVASRMATWAEVQRLVGTLGSAGHGMFQLALEPETRSPDPDLRREANRRLAALAVESGVPMTFGLFPGPGWQDVMATIEGATAAGGRMFAQTHSRGASHILTFRSRLHFDVLPEWAPIRALPLEEQRKAFEDPETLRRLVAATEGEGYNTAGGRPTSPDYDLMHVVTEQLPNPTVADMAAAQGLHPVELMVKLALETNFEQLFAQFVKEVRPASEAEHLELLRHPNTVMTFSDSGAHVSQMMDSSIHTHLLAYWVRTRAAFTLEEGVRMVSHVPAQAWNVRDRGLLREGYIADVNVFDPQRIAPDVPLLVADLPAGGKRLKQKSTGISATVVAGEVFLRDGEHTGALPGRLLRSSRGGVC
ncbi:N-acyl-D-amino-acid deacylase family protein [Pseudonocardia ailaonensis]|uniref:N-acyl-D-amino-acid deacylase family protein n=1 Tax=Pseudonocardia ailaonensis TaxID=367279 RepID=UPI0031D2A767